MNESKNIVVTPGGKWQVPIVQKIKSMGHKAFVIDSNEGAPSFKYADGHLVGDIFNVETCVAYCKEVGANAILTEECDIVWDTIVHAADILGITTLNHAAALMYVNKYMMREYAQKNGFPHPRYKLCRSAVDAYDFFEHENGKAIIKPIDSYSSRGVFVVNSKADIDAHVAETISQSRTAPEFLIEQYINGVEFTVDGIKTPFGHFTLAISEKKHYKHNDNIANELLFTHENDNFDYGRIRELIDTYVDNSPLKFGLTHTEYKYENGEFYMMETAARGGGNLISSHIVPFMSGVDNYEYLVNCFLGNGLDVKRDFSVADRFKKRAAVLKFFTTPGNGGVVKAVHGIDYINSLPEIVSWKLNFEVGSSIEPPKNDGARIGYYIACCESIDELHEIMANVEKQVAFDLM
ncbi:MAG: argininosuccinate lyase [Firmicutes bacterium ADurb.Bin182]|nr:MAG: argininosuccinate lyase [Firmicutes bacterium ADurb.Bin182]